MTGTSLLAVGLALVVLLGIVWLLRGDRAVIKACAAVGFIDLVAGLATARPWLACAGVIIFGTVAWAWRST